MGSRARSSCNWASILAGRSQKLSPQELLVETEKAIDEELYDWHMELQGADSAMGSKNAEKLSLESRITHTASIVESTKGDAEKVAKRNALKDEVGSLRYERRTVTLVAGAGQAA